MLRLLLGIDASVGGHGAPAEQLQGVTRRGAGNGINAAYRITAVA
jgi:hypothetical protein